MAEAPDSNASDVPQTDEEIRAHRRSVAAAAASIAQGWCESPVIVHLVGGDLVVSLSSEHKATLVG